MNHGPNCPCATCRQRVADMEDEQREIAREMEAAHWQQAARRLGNWDAAEPGDDSPTRRK